MSSPAAQWGDRNTNTIVFLAVELPPTDFAIMNDLLPS